MSLNNQDVLSNSFMRAMAYFGFDKHFTSVQSYDSPSFAPGPLKGALMFEIPVSPSLVKANPLEDFINSLRVDLKDSPAVEDLMKSRDTTISFLEGKVKELEEQNDQLVSLLHDSNIRGTK